MRDLEADIGQLLVGGFDGPAGYEAFCRLARAGRVGGAILFRRNLKGRLEDARDLTDALHGLRPEDPPMVAVDQEGGRVQRLRAPFPELPPMRRLGATEKKSVVHRAGRLLGRSLRAMGIDQNYAPVLDVDSNPLNPVIGDRAFSSDPFVVSRLGAAFVDAIQSEGVAACGKHFPGHGDTDLDSHLALPRLEHDLERLRSVELPPFHAAARAEVAAIMSAHVVFGALDPTRPATLSPAAIRLLRDEVRFEGVLVSDDLEMKAITDRYGVAEAAVLAVAAGCDQLLVCKHPERLEAAYEGLVRAVEDGTLAPGRVRASAARVRALKRRFVRVSPRPRDLEASFPRDGLAEVWAAIEGGGSPLAGEDPTERS
jgi:beta-N-acetylhexosaminidase